MNSYLSREKNRLSESNDFRRTKIMMHYGSVVREAKGCIEYIIAMSDPKADILGTMTSVY